MRRNLPSASPARKVELIDKAGHLPHLEQPEAVIKAVRAFLGG